MGLIDGLEVIYNYFFILFLSGGRLIVCLVLCWAEGCVRRVRACEYVCVCIWGRRRRGIMRIIDVF